MNNMILRRVSRTVGILALAMLLLAACMPVQPEADVSVTAQQKDMEAVIADIWAEYSDCVNTGDVERYVSLWAEDGVQLPPGQLPVVGTAAIRARRAAGAERNDYDMTITNQEVRAEGGWAYARGMYEVTITPKAGGEDILVDGKYMTILKQQPDGSWKIYRDLFNSNVP